MSLLIILSSCITQRVHLETYLERNEGSQYTIIKNIEYDEHGRPVFNKVLNERPSEIGEQYTLVVYDDNKPVKSFDIAVTGQKKPDLSRPLEVIYEWTGKGFKVGVNITENMLLSSHSVSGSDDAAIVYLAIITAPTVVGTITGFAIGLVACIPDSAVELKNLIMSKKETLISYALYEYDDMSRLTHMSIFAPSDQPVELVSTEFIYRSDEKVPYKTTIESHPEDRIRIIP